LIGLSVVIDELPDNDELENDDFDEISSSRVNLSSSLSFKIFFVHSSMEIRKVVSILYTTF
jgi:hypothetical protein